MQAWVAATVGRALLDYRGIGPMSEYHSNRRCMPHASSPSLRSIGYKGSGLALTSIGPWSGLLGACKRGHIVPMRFRQSLGSTLLLWLDRP